MISPTGVIEIRGQDCWGNGAFARPRGSRLHQGVDFITSTSPASQIIFPFREGKIIRIARPYAKDKRYSGCLMEAFENGTDYIAKMFYFDCDLDLVGAYVGSGFPLGLSQDLTLRYPGITPHVHLQVAEKDTPMNWFNPLSILDRLKEKH